MFGSDPPPRVPVPADATLAGALLVVTGATLVGFALATLMPESRLRRAYGVAVDDDAVARSNPAVLALVGIGVLLLAGVIAADVPGRIVGVAIVLASAGLCLVLGWLVRYPDRHELLTVPESRPEDGPLSRRGRDGLWRRSAPGGAGAVDRPRRRAPRRARARRVAGGVGRDRRRGPAIEGAVGPSTSGSRLERTGRVCDSHPSRTGSSLSTIRTSTSSPMANAGSPASGRVTNFAPAAVSARAANSDSPVIRSPFASTSTSAQST